MEGFLKIFGLWFLTVGVAHIVDIDEEHDRPGISYASVSYPFFWAVLAICLRNEGEPVLMWVSIALAVIQVVRIIYSLFRG